jgi:hypothetical protein
MLAVMVEEIPRAARPLGVSGEGDPETTLSAPAPSVGQEMLQVTDAVELRVGGGLHGGGRQWPTRGTWRRPP